MRPTALRRPRTATVLVWAMVAVCLVYGLFALDMARVEIFRQLGVAVDGEVRAAPPLFVLHSLSGTVALLTGAVQLALARRALARRPQLHRAVGRIYIAAAWTTAVAGLGTALIFDVGLAGRLAFAALAALWFATTTAALVHVRARRVREHREWMIRSFALAAVFVVFDPIRQALLAAAELPRTVVYPIAVLGGIALNLAVAELVLRRGKVNGHPITAPA